MRLAWVRGHSKASLYPSDVLPDQEKPVFGVAYANVSCGHWQSVSAAEGPEGKPANAGLRGNENTRERQQDRGRHRLPRMSARAAGSSGRVAVLDEGAVNGII